MITQIDRSVCRLLRERLDISLKALAEELGVEIEAGNASFNGSNATFKLKISTKNNDGTVNSKEAEDFKMYAFRWGLKPEDLNKEVIINGETYRISGAKPRSSKYPILAEQLTGSRAGTTFKFTPFRIQLALK